MIITFLLVLRNIILINYTLRSDGLHDMPSANHEKGFIDYTWKESL